MSYGYVQHPQQAPQNDPLWGWFCAVDTDRSGKIDEQELQKALTQSGIQPGGKTFSMETCQLCIRLLDANKNGTLDFNEFRELWNMLNQWKGHFTAMDRDRSGFIDEAELTRAVQSMGYRLSPQVIHVMALRYSNNSNKRINFDAFVACCLRMRIFTNSFAALDIQRTGNIYIGYDQFMHIVMSI